MRVWEYELGVYVPCLRLLIGMLFVLSEEFENDGGHDGLYVVIVLTALPLELVLYF